VNRVREKVHASDGMNLISEFHRVCVSPEQQLFEHKKDEETGQNKERGLNLPFRSLERLWQQVNERNAKKTAGRKGR